MAQSKDSPKSPGDRAGIWWLAVVTAVVFFTAGLAVGRFVLPTPAAGMAQIDSEAVTAIVRQEVQAALRTASPTPQPQQQPVVSNVSQDDDPALGSPDAQVVVVEFSDYQ